MASPFADCAGFSTSYQPDLEKYAVCANVTDFCANIKNIHSIELVMRWAIFVVPCTFSSLALLLNTYVFFVLIPAFRRMDDSTRKRYVFLLSRAVSSTMSVVSIILLPAVVLLTDYNFWFMAFFIIFDMLSFLSFLGGHVGTVLTVYVAVVHPVYYRHELSFRKCVLMVVTFWSSSIIVAFGCGTVQAAFMGKNAPFECDYASCERPVLMFAVCSISIAFAFSLGIQSFVIFALIWHQKKSKDRGDFSNTTKALVGVKRKLISGFVVFGTMALFEVTSAVYLVENAFDFTAKNSTLCDVFASSGSRLEAVIFSAILTLIWSIGSFFDPIFTILFDPIFSKSISRHVNDNAEVENRKRLLSVVTHARTGSFRALLVPPIDVFWRLLFELHPTVSVRGRLPKLHSNSRSVLSYRGPVLNRAHFLQDISSAMEVTKWLDIYISSSIFVVSGILNVYVLFTAIYAYMSLNEESRKHYVFVLMRSASSVCAVVALLILESSLFTQKTSSFAFYAFAFSFYNFSLNSLLISYISTSLITYFGVIHPIFYREKLTLRVLYGIAAGINVFSILTAIPFGLFQAASNAPGPVTCDPKYCVSTVEWITFSLACFTLLVSCLLTGFVVFALYWHSYKAQKNGGIKTHGASDRARIRLTWTFVALVLICFVELFPVAMLLGFRQNDFSTCDSFYRAREVLVQSIVSSVETFVGSLVFLTDPLLNVFLDKNISQTVRRQMTWLRARVCGVSM